MAADRQREADRLIADQKKIIESEATDRAKQFRKQIEMADKEKQLRHFAVVGGMSVLAILYCVILTVVWVFDHGAGARTIPQWFVNRWGDIVAVYSWMYGILPDDVGASWAAILSGMVAFLTVVALTAGLAAVSWVYIDNVLGKWGKPGAGWVCLVLLVVGLSAAIRITEATMVLTAVTWWLLLEIVLQGIYGVFLYLAHRHF